MNLSSRLTRLETSPPLDPDQAAEARAACAYCIADLYLLVRDRPRLAAPLDRAMARLEALQLAAMEGR